MFGILQLEGTPQAITREQAVKIKAVMNGEDPASYLGDYMVGQVGEILDASQKSFLESRRHTSGVDTARQKAVLAEFESIAGTKATEQVAMPAQAPRGGRSAAHYLVVLTACYDEMVSNPSLKPTPDQARKLLPYVNTFVNVPTTLQGIMLAALTDDQKKAIDLALSQPRTMPDQAEIGNRLSRITAERTR